MKTFLTLLFLLIWTTSFAEIKSMSAQELEAQGMIKKSQWQKQQTIAKWYTRILPRLSGAKNLEMDAAVLNSAEVVLEINKAKQGTSSWAQKMRVYHNGVLLKTITVSTAKEIEVKATNGTVYVASTPLGFFRPVTIWKEYQSSTWVGASMNFPVFFNGGIAVHATTPDHFKELGTRDSGGCVRMMPEDAQWVNELVLQTGMDSFEIKNRPRVALGKTLKRMQVVGGEVSVASVVRANGKLQTKKIKSWDTLIIVRNQQD